MTTLADFKVRRIDGTEWDLTDLRGRVVLLVNVASQCGYTPQYKGLQALYEEWRAKGVEVVGVPSNDFGAQEPGTDEEIRGFCESRYHVTFPMLSKVVVKGPSKHPLYAWLTASAQPPGEVGWNFEKFLVDRDGQVVGRFPSRVAPESSELRNALARLTG